jgi:putative inorganic carbon (hco3(-)) transporter
VRVVGTFGQPNPYSGYLNLALPLLLALAAWAADVRVRLAGGAVALLIGGALALAQSRGALIGLGAALLVMAWVGWPQLRRWFAGGAALSIISVMASLVAGRITWNALLEKMGWRPLTDVALSHNVTDANFSTVERLAHWAAATRMATAHPLTGVGAGNYPVVYHLYAVPHWQLPLGHAHNLYLNMAAELGIIGALAYLAVVAAGLWLVVRAITDSSMSSVKNFPCPPCSPILLGVLGGVVAVATHNMVDDLTTHALLLEQMLLLACVTGSRSLV